MRWVKFGNVLSPECSERLNVGQFCVTVDWDTDACWTYTIDYGCHTVREFGDYIRSFGTKKKAKEKAEEWLLRELGKMARSMKLELSGRTMYRGSNAKS